MQTGLKNVTECLLLVLSNQNLQHRYCHRDYNGKPKISKKGHSTSEQSQRIFRGKKNWFYIFNSSSSGTAFNKMASSDGINFFNILFTLAVHRKSEEDGCPGAKGKVFRQLRCLSSESLSCKMWSVQPANAR
jgi:hypothetical protein